MKQIFLLLGISICILFTLGAKSENYNIYSPDNYSVSSQPQDMTLFILDFSNSMSEYLEGKSKAEMMIDTVKKLLPTISENSYVGLRVYGHKAGFTPFDACRASSLVVPVEKRDIEAMDFALSKTKPRGMTPITYSLKQAIRNDFIGFTGRKHIILLTDGGENCDESPCKFVIELMKIRRDVTIDVIAFNIKDKDDLAQLRCTSLVTGGKFYSANTAAELAKSLGSSARVHKEVEAKILPSGR